LNFLFWNVNKMQLDTELADLIVSTRANFVGIAEYQGDGKDLLRLLSKRGVNFYGVPTVVCKEIKVFSDRKPGVFSLYRDIEPYIFTEMRVPGLKPLLIGIVHLPSKQHNDYSDQTQKAEIVKNELELVENEADHKNTIVIGDFNMNPFEMGMTYTGAFNAVPCLRTGRRESRELRTIWNKDFTFFYNPSWNLLGDLGDSPGTYYLGSAGSLSNYWNTYDQVIVRPSIADSFQKSSLRILTTTSTKSLVDANGKPAVSDHLPIFFSMDLS
jgi:hypothetical protein